MPQLPTLQSAAAPGDLFPLLPAQEGRGCAAVSAWIGPRGQTGDWQGRMEGGRVSTPLLTREPEPAAYCSLARTAHYTCRMQQCGGP